MFTLVIKLDDATAARFDRLMDFLEGSDQAKVDTAAAAIEALAGRLSASATKLKTAVQQGEN